MEQFLKISKLETFSGGNILTLYLSDRTYLVQIVPNHIEMVYRRKVAKFKKIMINGTSLKIREVPNSLNLLHILILS